VKKSEAVALVDRMTPREREVFDALVDGRPASNIAEALGISRRTVQAHRSAISRKLETSNLADFARLAIRAGAASP